MNDYWIVTMYVHCDTPDTSDKQRLKVNKRASKMFRWTPGYSVEFEVTRGRQEDERTVKTNVKKGLPKKASKNKSNGN